MLTVHGTGNIYSIEEKTNAKGTKMATATVRDGTKNRSTGEWDSRFTDVIAFGSAAEAMLRLKKGTAVVYNGPAELDVDSKGKARMKVVINFMEMAPKDRSEAGEAGGGEERTQAPARASAPQARAATPAPKAEEEETDPFADE